MIWVTLFALVARLAQRAVRNGLVALGAVNVWNAIVYLFHLLVRASTAFWSAPIWAANRSIAEFFLTWYALLLCAYVYLACFIACRWQVLETLKVCALITIPAMVIVLVGEFRRTFFSTQLALTLIIYKVAISALQASISEPALLAVINDVWAWGADLVCYCGRFVGEIYIYGLIS